MVYLIHYEYQIAFVKNIQSSRKKYEDLLGYETISDIISDSFQKVKVQFLRNSNGQKIELIEMLFQSAISADLMSKRRAIVQRLSPLRTMYSLGIGKIRRLVR